MVDEIMRYVTASEAQLRFGPIMDTARREPVTIQKNGRDSVVIMAIEDYEKLSKQMVKAFQNFCNNAAVEAQNKGMTEEILEDILKSDHS